MTLAQDHLHMKIKTGFSQNPVGHFKPHCVCKLFGTRNLKFNDMTRWSPCLYMFIILQKSSSSEPLDPFSRNLVCIICDSSPSYFVQMVTMG